MSANLTLRLTKTVPLTAAELDNNFTNLNAVISDPDQPSTSSGYMAAWNTSLLNWQPTDAIRLESVTEPLDQLVLKTPLGLKVTVGSISAAGSIFTGNDETPGGEIYNNGGHRNEGFATNTIFGKNSFIDPGNTANNCTTVGQASLTNKTSGDNSTAVGYQALQGEVDGLSNTVVGSVACKFIESGLHNTVIGAEALKGVMNMTTSDQIRYNIVIGRQAATWLLDGGNNTIIGSGAQPTPFETAGTMDNTLVIYSGESSERLRVTNAGIRTNNIAALTVDGSLHSFGGSSIDTNFAGGKEALLENTSGLRNTAVGRRACQENTVGVDNTAIGNEALKNNVNGQSSVAIGSYALTLATVQAGNNIGIGKNAGSLITTGASNTIIGSWAGTSDLSQTVWIGSGSQERIRVDANGLLINGNPVRQFDFENVVTGDTINNTTDVTFTHFVPYVANSSVRYSGTLLIETFIGGAGTAGIPLCQSFAMTITPTVLGSDGYPVALLSSPYGVIGDNVSGQDFLPNVSQSGNVGGLNITLTGNVGSGTTTHRMTYLADDINPQ